MKFLEDHTLQWEIDMVRKTQLQRDAEAFNLRHEKDAKIAQLEKENEALAKALEYLIQKIDDSDGIDTDRLEQCRAVLAEYAKRKQEGGS